MILVAADVWVFSGLPGNPQVTSKLRDLVRSGEVLGHSFVYLELMLLEAGRVSKLVTDRYCDLDQVLPPNDKDVLLFIEKHSLGGRSIRPMDAYVLTAAHANRAKVWTLDPALHKVATELGIAYDPSAKEAV